MENITTLRNPRLQSAYSLVESLIVAAIIGILTALSLPAFTDSLDRNRMVKAAEAIHALLERARSDGMLRDQDMTFTARTSTTPWCVGYSAAADCDCRSQGSCVVNTAGFQVLQTLIGSEFPGVSINSNLGNDKTTFSRIRGSASRAGTVAVSNGPWQLNIVISNYGRVRLCNPHHGSHPIVGYPSC